MNWRSASVRILGFLLSVAISAIIIGGYLEGWLWTGFVVPSSSNSQATLRPLWDWLELLIIPLTVVLASHFLNRAQWRREIAVEQRRIEAEQAAALERFREKQLQLFFDRISALLDGNLKGSRFGDDGRALAQIWSLAVLRSLDPRRKAVLLKFIYEAGLIWASDSIIKLDNVDLSGLDLHKVNLNQADFRAVVLSGSDLVQADLFGTNLSMANLSGVDMSFVSCFKGRLVSVNLEGAKLIGADFDQSDLSGSSFANALIQNASFRGASLVNTVFDGANLANANFSTLKDTENSYATDLSGASFVGADLSHTDFTGAYLFGVDFSGAIMTDTVAPSSLVWSVKGMRSERN